MYWPYYIKIRKEDVNKTQKILDKFENKGDIDNYRFERWDENTELCCFAPIVSSYITEITNKLKENGIQII